MSGKINRFLREYIFGLSIIVLIVGLVITLFGVLGIWTTVLHDSLNIPENILVWSPYIFVIGIILFLTGVYYLYAFLKNKRFLIEEIETKRRSDFIKKHQELKNSVRFLPSKYQNMLKEKEKELKIK